MNGNLAQIRELLVNFILNVNINHHKRISTAHIGAHRGISAQRGLSEASTRISLSHNGDIPYPNIDIPHPSAAKVVVCPPYPYASFVLGRLAELGWQLGAQDCSAHGNGPYTGEVSAEMLKDIGCRYVLLGHSERRQHHQESNALICEKMQRAFAAGLIPVLCIGETLQQREANQTFSVIESQLSDGLPKAIEAKAHQSDPFIIAYEPVWAIGTGHVAALHDIQDVHRYVRDLLCRSYPDFAGVPIVYGGSVNGQNASDILKLIEVDGVLVGGASLKSDDFSEIIAHSWQDAA